MKKFTTTILSIILLVSAAAFSPAAEKKILIESFTGTWCGPCGSYGKPTTKSVLNTWPDNVFVTEFHVGSDPFVIEEAGPLQQAFGISGVPAGLFNREPFNTQDGVIFGLHPNYWEQVIPDILENTAPVEVSLFYSINQSTRELTATITAEFTESYNEPCELHFNVYINENHLVYSQANQGPNYDHMHVCRKVLGGPWGTAGIIPNSVQAGDVFTHTYTYTLDSEWKIDDLEFFGVVNEYHQSDGNYVQILNACQGTMGQPKSELAVEGNLFSLIENGNSFDKSFTLKNLTSENLTYEIEVVKSDRTPDDWTADLQSSGAVIKSKKDKTNSEIYEIDVDNGQSIDLTLSLTANSIGIGDVSMTIYDKWEPDGQKSKGKISALTQEAQHFEIISYKDEKYSVYNILNDYNIDHLVQMNAEEFDQYNYLLDNVNTLIWNCGEEGPLSSADASNITNAINGGANVLIMGTVMTHSLKDNASSLLNYIGVEYLKPCYQGASNGQIQIQGYENDPITDGFNQAGQLIKYLTPAFKAIDGKAEPILKHRNTDSVIACRSIVNDSRVVLFGITPYVITNTSARTDLLQKTMDWLAGLGPAIETAASVNFEDTEIGETSTQTLTITNSGKTDLKVTNVEIQYEFSHIFSVVGETAFTIKGGDSQDIQIKFTPAYAIQYDSWVNITSNAENAPSKTVNLSAKGLEGTDVNEYNDNNVLLMNVGPNPFEETTKLKLNFNDKMSRNVEIYIVDALGQKVKSINNSTLNPGSHSFTIESNSLAAGKYFIIAKTSNAVSQIPVVINK